MLETAPFGRRQELSVAINPIKADIRAVTSARYISVCSGIEAATCAWHGLGWEPLAFSEIEPFPRALLQHHYPDVPLHGDFTLLRDQDWIVDADILVGGTPCQSFSVAGKRASLADERGNLSLEFVRLADAIDNLRLGAGRPGCTIVWENVPGVFSTSDNAFGCFLAALVGETDPLQPTGGRWTDAGMVVGPQRRAAWRVLDAQFFGVPQRRRRVFVIASARDGFCPGEVLFERKSVQRHSPPRRETGEGLAPTISARTKGGGGLGTDFDCDGGLIAPEISLCLNAGGMGRQDSESETLIAHSLRAEGFDASEDGTGRGTPIVPIDMRQASRGAKFTNNRAKGSSGGAPGTGIGKAGDPAPNIASSHVPAIAFESRFVRNGRGAPDTIVPPLKAQSGQSDAAPLVAFAQNQRDEVRTMAVAGELASEPGMKQQTYIASTAVRRLTVRECERLQGFPDDYTLIPYRGKPAADGPRYKALGNSMVVPCMRWIGQRIERLSAQ